jgi:hypothetical protein
MKRSGAPLATWPEGSMGLIRESSYDTHRAQRQANGVAWNWIGSGTTGVGVISVCRVVHGIGPTRER